MPGEKAAAEKLKHFLSKKLTSYPERRNDPTKGAVSNLSPYLHFGQISAQRVALEVLRRRASSETKDAFLEELIVRDGLAGTRKEDALPRQFVAPLENPEPEAVQILDMKVGNGGFAPPGNNPVSPSLRKPAVQKYVKGSVLTPVADHRSQADDGAGQPARGAVLSIPAGN